MMTLYELKWPSPGAGRGGCGRGGAKGQEAKGLLATFGKRTPDQTRVQPQTLEMERLLAGGQGEGGEGGGAAGAAVGTGPTGSAAAAVQAERGGGGVRIGGDARVTGDTVDESQLQADVVVARDGVHREGSERDRAGDSADWRRRRGLRSRSERRGRCRHRT